MNVGTAPLALGVMIAGARLLGFEMAAETLGAVYLLVATVLMARSANRPAPLRAGA